MVGKYELERKSWKFLVAMWSNLQDGERGRSQKRWRGERRGQRGGGMERRRVRSKIGDEREGERARAVGRKVVTWKQ